MAISKIGTNSIDTITGINFADSQTASADANTLDDYEEGTFTPDITADATMGTVGWSHRYGYYTKVGDRVYFDIYTQFNMSSEQDVQVFVSGLPFTCSNANSGRRAFPVTISQWYNNTTKDTFITPDAWINPNSTRVIMAWPNGGTGEGIVDSDLQSAGSVANIYVAGQYGI